MLNLFIVCLKLHICYFLTAVQLITARTITLRYILVLIIHIYHHFCILTCQYYLSSNKTYKLKTWWLCETWLFLTGSWTICRCHKDRSEYSKNRKEGNVLFTQICLSYGYVALDLVKDHTGNERWNPLLPLHGLIYPVSNKESFIYIPSQDSTYHSLWYTTWLEWWRKSIIWKLLGC